MANPQLTKRQREHLFTPLFKKTRDELERLSGGDADLLFALRRKLAKELGYLERGVPMMRGTAERGHVLTLDKTLSFEGSNAWRGR